MRRLARSTSALGVVAAMTVAVLLATSPAHATMGVIQRPISDFVDAQGSTNLFIPPVPDYIGWFDNPPHEFASVDYAGLVSEWLIQNGGPNLGTIVSGTVVDRPLQDGRTLVTVVLNTQNANSWVVPFGADFATGPLLFGYRGQDLLANPSLTPALCGSHFRVDFKNTAPGAALPDLVDAFILGNAAPGQELRMLSFRAEGNGPLRAEFGVPDGTPGRLGVSQTGLFMTQFQGATGDGFPAERVDLTVIGQ
ncbi:MAG TPA: hypothetical protein VFP58_13710 [Candidatus Eisenbacteria bacterium]|nr:hypothetical protein [Candidatus Eisenbacteria bacterium]